MVHPCLRRQRVHVYRLSFRLYYPSHPCRPSQAARHGCCTDYPYQIHLHPYDGCRRVVHQQAVAEAVVLQVCAFQVRTHGDLWQSYVRCDCYLRVRGRRRPVLLPNCAEKILYRELNHGEGRRRNEHREVGGDLDLLEQNPSTPCPVHQARHVEYDHGLLAYDLLIHDHFGVRFFPSYRGLSQHPDGQKKHCRHRHHF